MGLIDFIKNVGHKLNVGHDDPKPAQAAPTPKAAQGPSQQEMHALENRKKATALTNLVQQMGLKGENLNVQVDGEKATLTGKVDSQEQREKIVLLVGNTEGIGKVDDQLQVRARSRRPSTTTSRRATACRRSPSRSMATPISTTGSSRPTSRCSRTRTRSIPARSCASRPSPRRAPGAEAPQRAQGRGTQAPRPFLRFPRIAG